jgi:flagellar biosynthetic protein FliR
MLNDLVNSAPLFFLIAARILAIVETSPLLSSEAIPQAAKVALAGFGAFCAYPSVAATGYPIPPFGLQYALLVVGEALIGIIIGFFLTIVYATFTTAGQFFSLQMGFGASETFDPLAEIEIPLLGQYLNLMAMFIFVSTGGFQKLFVLGLTDSFSSLTAYSLVARKDDIVLFLLKGLAGLFEQAIVLSFPILGTLLIVYVAMGLLAKAAPQMNLHAEGFAISILVAWVLIIVSLPFMMEGFGRLMGYSFDQIALFLKGASS